MMADVVLVAAGMVIALVLVMGWALLRAILSTPEKRYERFMTLEGRLTEFQESANRLPRWMLVGVLVWALGARASLPAMVVALMWLVWR